jgi:O-antigen/teichoic acid export membrane protein
MRQLFGRLGRQALVYGIGGALLQAVGLVTLPIYARIFTPAQFGLLEVATVGFTALLVIVDSGMSSAAQRSFYDYPEEQEAERRAALATGLMSMMTMALVVSAVMVALARPISSGLFGGPGRADLVRIIGVSVPVATLAAYLREVMRLRLRPWRYVTSAVIGAVGTATAGIVAVLAFNAGVSGVLLGILIGSGFAALYGLAIAARDVAGRFSASELRRMLHYGVPLIPAAAAMWGLTFLDRVMLSQLGSFSDTGEYAVGSRYAAVLMFGISTFMTAYVPFFLSLWQEDVETERQIRARVLSYMTLALVGTGLVLSLFAREITTIVAPGYDKAYLVVGVLCTGVALYSVASIATAGISLARKTKYQGAYTIVAVALNVGLNFLLIPAWGMIGAATATAAAYGLLSILYYRKAQQLSPTPYFLRRVLTTLVIGCPLMAIGAISIRPLGLAIAVKLATLGVFALAVWRQRLIDEDEVRALIEVVRQLRPGPGVATPTPAP